MINKDLLRKLKLIVFDLDGTLLNDAGEIGEETIQLVSEIKKFGVTFSFATGRLHNAITGFAEKLNLKAPLISLDGCFIKSYPDAEVIFESYISPKYVQRAIDMADKYLLRIGLCHSEAIYYIEYNHLIEQLLDKLGSKFREIQSYENYKNKVLEVVIAGDYREVVSKVKEKFVFPFSFGLNTSFYKSHSHGDIYYLEIRRKGSDKGTGLKRLAKHLKVSLKQTAVIGDWYNDRSLFETGALKIAVANAVPEIKRMADFVTNATNNEDATAEFLRMVLHSHRN